MNKLIIIDGYSLLFRAYYATAYKGEDTIMRTSDGTPINAIFTFANMVLPIVNSLKNGDSICVCLDTGKKTYRHDILDSYKGNRPPCPEPLIVQMPILREFLDCFNISHLEIDGFEADDVAGTIAYKFKDFDDVQIYTSDKDYLQLVTENISINLMKKGMKDIQNVNVNNFEELFQMKPDQIRDFKGLCGDSSDNLKGIPGVGEKTALTLINKYQSLENIYEKIDELKGKLKENLIANKEQGELCKRLATINKNIDLDVRNDDLLFKGFDALKVQTFIKKYEMKSLISKVKSVKEEIIQINKQINLEYVEVETLPRNKEKYLGFAAILNNYKENYHLIEPIGFALYYNSKIYYISSKNAAKDVYFSEMLENNDIKKCVYSSKEIYYILKKLNINISNIYIDLMLSSYLTDSNKSDDLESTFKFYKKDINLEVDPVLVGCQIAKFSYELKDDALLLLEKANAEDLYFNIELPLAKVLSSMEYEGFPVSKKVLENFKITYESEIERLKREIYKYSTTEFNISSPQQVAKFLFEELGLKSNKKSSTSIDYLKYIIDEHPVVSLILEYRRYSKLLSTYVMGLISNIYEDNKLHCIFNQGIATTGRLSSSEPNMQNITVRDVEGKEIRKAFFYENNNLYKLLSFDYSQIELRVLASLSKCTKLIDAFNQGIDIHTLTAQQVFGTREITSFQRRQAKAVNFGIVYGISDYGLKEQLGVSLFEAKEIINKFYQAYPEIGEFLAECVEFAEENGYAKTFFNRRRYLPQIHAKEYNVREFAKRAAMNAPIQGTAADIIKIVMIKIDELLQNYDSKLVLTIHDELIFKLNVNEQDELVPMIKHIMEDTIKMSVKFEVDGGVADNWYDVK